MYRLHTTRNPGTATTCGTARTAEYTTWCQHWHGIAKNDMRANMTMSNAQAALIAASNSAVRGSAVPVEPVLRRAAAFLLWLDSQDERDEDVNIVSINELHKPQAIVQCKAASANYTRCMLASGHGGEHRNSAEGEYWDDAAIERPVHFIPSPSARHTVCGRGTGVTEDGYRRVTTSVMGVTCDTCKEDLGL